LSNEEEKLEDLTNNVKGASYSQFENADKRKSTGEAESSQKFYVYLDILMKLLNSKGFYKDALN
jgi:hypothetical protein